MTGMKQTWRRVRVVVEVPVQGSSYGEKDLSWDVQRCLDDRLPQVHRDESVRSGSRFGRHVVKSASKMQVAVRKARASLQEQIDELKSRIDRITDYEEK